MTAALDPSPPVVLAVGGTDSGGAAGLAADLATLSHLGCHGACAVTALTAQDTTGVRAIHAPAPGFVAEQIAAVLDDLPVAVVKTGMLGSPEVVALVHERLGHLPLVVDPVLAATSGAVLAGPAVVAAYREVLLPVATVATPNLGEAEALTGRRAHPRELAARVADLGCAVVLTGGPQWRPGTSAATCTDWLAEPGASARPLTHPAVATTADHGTGCTYASALAAQLAHGTPLLDAAVSAAGYVTDRLAHSSTWRLGRGRGPIAHLAPTVPQPTLPVPLPTLPATTTVPQPTLPATLPATSRPATPAAQEEPE